MTTSDLLSSRTLHDHQFSVRMRAAISFAWSMFSRKVAGESIVVNKEASMQLHLSHIIQQVVPLITFTRYQGVRVQLESAANLGSSTRSIDILVSSVDQVPEYRIAVELKCYKTRSSSGGLRGATDIFMKDVYQDLALLEQYVDAGLADEGVALVMTDLERLVSPSQKSAKCWDYDISDGAEYGPGILTTPIGGKPVSIELNSKYRFDWHKQSDYWFAEIQGQPVSRSSSH